jgi:hypothetical protein
MSGVETPTGHEKLNREEGGTFFRNQELLTEPVKTKESFSRLHDRVLPS